MNTDEVYGALKKYTDDKFMGTVAGGTISTLGDNIVFNPKDGGIPIILCPKPKDGTDGLNGEKGEQGIQGEKGEKGDNGLDGISIIDIIIRNNHLICKLSNGKEIDAGVMPGGGPESSLTGDWVTNTSFGGLEAGTDTTGKTALELLKMASLKYIKPDILSFTINPSTLLFEKGCVAKDIILTATIVKKYNPITSLKFYQGNSLINTKTPSDTSGLENGGTFSFKNTNNITSDVTLKASVTDDTDVTTKYINLKFVYPFYCGTSELTKIIKEKGDYVYKFSSNNESVVFKYPSVYGELKSILDKNSFENLTAFTKSVENITCSDGTTVSYNVYTSGKATLSDFSYTFKF